MPRDLGPSTGQSRRRYKRLWSRLRRSEDPAARRRDAERSRRYMANPAKRAHKRRIRQAWGQAHREHLRRYNREYHRKFVQRRCWFCGRPGKAGRGNGVREIERLVPEHGQLVPRRVLWCGSCHAQPPAFRRKASA